MNELLTLNVSGMSLASGDGLTDGLGDVVDVVRGDPAHRDPRGLQQIEGPLLLKPYALIFGQAHIREHSNLGRDVAEEGRVVKLSINDQILTSNLLGFRVLPSVASD